MICITCWLNVQRRADWSINNWVSLFMGPFFLILLDITIKLIYNTGPIRWIFSQPYGYWWPGLLVPTHAVPALYGSIWYLGFILSDAEKCGVFLGCADPSTTLFIWQPNSIEVRKIIWLRALLHLSENIHIIFRYKMYADRRHKRQGLVSLTFRETFKRISRKYTMPEITFIVRISSWNFVHVPLLWAHVRSFSLKIS